MNTLLLWMVLAGTPCYQDEVVEAFHAVETEQLLVLYENAPTLSDSLQTLYRLFPLVQDKSLLDDLPEDLPGAAGADVAVLSALWGYRIDNGGLMAQMRLGPRAVRLMDRAIDQAPNDPLVRLIAGQHFANRPAFAGGNRRKALVHLAAARELLQAERRCGMVEAEARVWAWIIARGVDVSLAQEMRDNLDTERLPPVFQRLVARTEDR